MGIGGEKDGESQGAVRGRGEGGEGGGGLERVEGGRERAGHGGPSEGRAPTLTFSSALGKFPVRYPDWDYFIYLRAQLFGEDTPMEVFVISEAIS